MSKLKISAKQVLNDINAGMSNAELMEKYGVTSKGLEAVFSKLRDAGLSKMPSQNPNKRYLQDTRRFLHQALPFLRRRSQWTPSPV